MKIINITDRSNGEKILFGAFYLLMTVVGVNEVIHQWPDVTPVEASNYAVEQVVEIEGVEEIIEVPVVAKETPVEVVDPDVVAIRSYLRSYGSPHPEFAEVIVRESRKHGVDPYVITAISCQESSCFKNCVGGNCAGYGITDSGVVTSIHEQGKGSGIGSMIAKYSGDWGGYYKNCGRDIDCISYKYNNRDSWRGNVKWFLNNISSHR